MLVELASFGAGGGCVPERVSHVSVCSRASQSAVAS